MSRHALDDHSVVVIIGSRAGGGTLAHELCRRGIPVVLLEAGPRIEADSFRNDEMFTRWIERHAHLSGVWLNGEDLPVATNRVTLSPMQGTCADCRLRTYTWTITRTTWRCTGTFWSRLAAC